MDRVKSTSSYRFLVAMSISCGARFVTIAIVFLAILSSSLGAVTTDTFTSAVDDTWENPGNWDLGTIPDTNDVVVIPVLQSVLLTSVTSAIGGLDLDGQLTIGSGQLNWTGSQTWLGSGSILFSAVGPNSIQDTTGSNDVLIISSTLTIHGTSVSIDGTPQTIINEGTIDCDVAGGYFYLSSFSNSGTIEETQGGTLDLKGSWSSSGSINGSGGGTMILGGSFSGASASTITTQPGETIEVAGTCDNTGSTLSLNASTGSWIMYGGEIDGGVLQTTATDVLICSEQGGELNGVTLNSGSVIDLSYPNLAFPYLGFPLLIITNGMTVNGQILLKGNSEGTPVGIQTVGIQTWGGSGSIVLGGETGASFLSISPFSGGSLTISPGLTLSGLGSISVDLVNQGTITSNASGSLIDISGTCENTGTISATSGGTIQFGGSWSSTGPILEDDSTLELGGDFSTASFGCVSTSNGGMVLLTGALENTNSVLTLNAATGPLIMENGAIVGGSINTTLPNVISVVNNGYIDGVTIAPGTIIYDTDPSAVLLIQDGLILNGEIAVGPADGSAAVVVTWRGSQTWTGTGEFRFGRNLGNQIQPAGLPSDALTVAPPLVLAHSLTITAISQSMVAGSQVPVLTCIGTGLVDGETLATLTLPPTVSTTATSSSPAGSYPITVTGAADPNYTITTVAGVLTIANPGAASTSGPTGSASTSTSGATGPTATSTTAGGGAHSSSGGGCGLGTSVISLLTLGMLSMRNRIIHSRSQKNGLAKTSE